ncbi:MAG: hypothetical protein PHX59_01005 [Sulfuricurvum sp.]|nr:hypothetical protein [Sulfuricurvum sp.]
MREARRSFLKRSVYVAPALIMLGELSAHASGNCHNAGGHHEGSHGHNGSGNAASTLNCKPVNNCHKGNNGWGNGDQDAPGKSLHHNNAENNHNGKENPNNLVSCDKSVKDKVNNVGVKTHGGHEKDYGKNNGWGNGDQDAPGGSLPHNKAENYIGA